MAPFRSPVRVVTVATQLEEPSGGEGHLDRLARSCHACGLDLTVLGLGQQWRGFGTKLLLLQEHLASCPPDELVLFADAYDVLVLGGPEELASRFQTFGTPLVFCAEIVCWPRESLAGRYPEPTSTSSWQTDRVLRRFRPSPPIVSPFRYLNSGSYMGHAWALSEALRDLSPAVEDDDQELFTLYFLDHPDRVALDHECTLFQSLFGVSVDELDVIAGSPPEVRSRRTGSSPCVLHGNGHGMGTFLGVWRRLQAIGWPEPPRPASRDG